MALGLLVASPAWAQVVVTATWDRNTDAYTAGYRVHYGTSSGNYQWSVDVGNAISAPLNLSPGFTYYFVVRAYNASYAQGPPSSEVSFQLPGTPPPPPTGPPGVPTNVATNVAGSRVTVSWSQPTTGGAVSQYLLSVGTQPGASNVANGLSVGNVLSASGDLPPGTYYLRVWAANAAGTGPASADLAFTVNNQLRPPAPSALVASWQGTAVTLSWTAPANAVGGNGPTSYVLEAGTSSGASNVASSDVGNVTSLTTDVPPGTYYVRIRAVNAFGVSDPSNEIVLQAAGAPGAPTSLSASGAGSAVNLRWTAPTTGTPITGYVIEAGSAPGLANLATIQIGNVTSFSTTATPGTYYVRVRAVNARGVGAPSNQIVVRR